MGWDSQIDAWIVGLRGFGQSAHVIDEWEDTPDDFGRIAAFLCSDDARWITGQRLEVSGGFKL